MTDTSSRFTWGLLGLVVGFLMAAAIFGVVQRFQPFGGGMEGFGMPVFFMIFPMLFGTFWIVLIAVAIRWLFMSRDKQPGRLADLPADFDDWHRRAHAQMDREAAARAGGTQP
jgi:multisubunit Na+/H+ antiporter MnhE subunit